MPIYKKRPIEQVYGLIVHEAVHVWQRIVEHIGEHKPSDEFMAYGIQTIAQELMFAYKEAKK